MPNDEFILDRNVLAQFQNVLTRMKISERSIQISAQDLELPPLDFSVRSKLELDGIELDGTALIEPPESPAPQIYLKYEQHPVIVYLRDAHAKNRYESRYVMTYNTSGNFKVNLWIRDKNSDGQTYTFQKEQNVYRRLKVCKHCLHEINWQHFRSYCGGGLEWWRSGNYYMRQKIFDNFDLEEYFLSARKNNFLDHPVMGKAASAIRKEYVLSPQIKEALKEINDYTCEVCHRQFAPNELQIHHKNHNEGDNRRQNLMVVCQDCHALIHEAEGGFVSRRKKSPVTSYAAAQKNLGDMYANGWGVAQNINEAKKILASIGKNVELVDSELVELCLLAGNINDALIFHAKAVQMFEVAENHGDETAALELAKLYSFKDLISEVNKNLVDKLFAQAATECLEKSAEYEKAKAALKKLYYDGEKNHAVGTVILPAGLTSIGDGAFSGCYNLKKITYHKKTEPLLRKYFGRRWSELNKTVVD